MRYNKYYKIARYLKTHYSFDYPVIVRRTKMPANYCGECDFENGNYLIKINKILSENSTIDTLLHEMAHAKSWEKDTEHHGPTWGKEYSKLYRVYEKEFLR